MSEQALEPPRDERQAIQWLADALGDLACACYSEVGERVSYRIQRVCNVIGQWAVPISSAGPDTENQQQEKTQ